MDFGAKAPQRRKGSPLTLAVHDGTKGDRMSDHYIELIPQFPAFVPIQDAISKSVRLLEEIAPEAETVTADISQDIEF
jgi:hypothetical protein